MLIKYIGHSCFKIRDNETGYSIVIDPYQKGYVRGFGDILDTASEVLCTHDHADHNAADCIIIEPKDESPYDVQVIDTFHDPEKGALRGKNRIYVITHKKTGERLVHYGDIGEVIDDLLTEENMELLRDADIALIPVGGVYTYDKDEALELMARTKPKLMIPMHFRSGVARFGLENIGTVEDFLDAAAAKGHGISVGQLFFIDTDEYRVKSDILVLRPQNI